MKRLLLSFVFAIAFCSLAVLSVSAQAPMNITVTQVDQSRFPQIDVFVSVTDTNGNPVRNVAPNAFQLQENGKPIALTAATHAGESNPVSTVLIIDHSGSMASAGKMTAAKQAASAFVNHMRPGDKTALIQFDTEIETLQAFTEDKNALLAVIQKIVPRGNTAIYDAVNQAAKYFEATQGRKDIILVTDGMDNASKINRETIVDKVSKSGFSINTIGLGAKGAGYGSQDGIDETVLQDLAHASMGTYYYRPDAAQLSELYQQLSFLIQNEYKLTYTSTSPLRDGVKRNIVVTAPGAAATQTTFNPGGVIPEAESQLSSWVMFAIALLVLLGLFFLPLGLQIVRERGVNLPALPTPQAALPAAPPKPSRVKLTGDAPTASATTSTRQRIKIKQSSGATRSQNTMPWDEGADKH
ncbi:MAG: VWA domain-containing protein [Chloroflexi bacterium]|nr:VWA domain-containing protein [Chloroflexota bacterium]